jgi:hypothetical protein
MCNCKNNVLKRAKTLLNGRKWEELDDITSGQIEGLYYEKFKSYGTQVEIKNWLNTKI